MIINDYIVRKGDINLTRNISSFLYCIAPNAYAPQNFQRNIGASTSHQRVILSLRGANNAGLVSEVALRINVCSRKYPSTLILRFS